MTWPITLDSGILPKAYTLHADGRLMHSGGWCVATLLADVDEAGGPGRMLPDAQAVIDIYEESFDHCFGCGASTWDAKRAEDLGLIQPLGTMPECRCAG